MTLSLADRCSKTQKIRILPMAGRDPESHRNEMIKVTFSLFVFPSLLWKASYRSQKLSPDEKYHSQLHKDITWGAYIMRSDSGWCAAIYSVSKSREGVCLCFSCQPRQVLLIGILEHVTSLMLHHRLVLRCCFMLISVNSLTVEAVIAGDTCIVLMYWWKETKKMFTEITCKGLANLY